MPVYRLTDRLVFPPPEGADESGLVAIGGDARPERLLLGCSVGIFPWPHGPRDPLLWFSPDPRFVLPLDGVQVPRSLRKTIRRSPFTVRFDTRFDDVMRECAKAERPGQRGTWITPELLRGYGQLHALGFAHSVEAYRDDELVGGLYGVSLGRAFFGESMFAKVDDASKVAFVTLLGHLRQWGFELLDSQVYTDHVARFGAVEIDRSDYLTRLHEAVAHPTLRGPWFATMAPIEALAVLSAQGA